jgi:nucleoside transporter
MSASRSAWALWLARPSSFFRPERPDEPAPDVVLLRTRLALFMFLGFAIIGSWIPVFTLYLKERLAFSPSAVAWACATNAVGALCAPLLWGQIADRWLAAQRCISLCALASGALLLVMAEATAPAAVFAICIAFWFFSIPTLSLGTALIFRQLQHPERDYGKVRLWGTVGWMAASLLLGLWLSFEGARPDLADSMRLGAIFAFLVAGYALTLPHTPPSRRPAGDVADASRLRRFFDAPLLAFRLLRRRSFATYCACLFGSYVTMPFTTQLNPLLLRQLGVADSSIPAALTIAQCSEIAALALLPLFLSRLQLRPTMVLGIASWSLGLSVLAVGQPLSLVLASLATHGVYICCFLVSGQVFVNRHAGHDFRASAQGMITLISGMGLLSGHLLVGWLRQQTGDDYALVYLPAAVAAALLTIVFALGFRDGAAPAAAPVVPASQIT